VSSEAPEAELSGHGLRAVIHHTRSDATDRWQPTDTEQTPQRQLSMPPHSLGSLLARPRGSGRNFACRLSKGLAPRQRDDTRVPLSRRDDQKLVFSEAGLAMQIPGPRRDEPVLGCLHNHQQLTHPQRWFLVQYLECLLAASLCWQMTDLILLNQLPSCEGRCIAADVLT
jgi:hypothetical protein